MKLPPRAPTAWPLESRSLFMYPLNVILVGCGNDLLVQVRAELAAMGAKIDIEFLGFESAIGALRDQRAEEGARVSTVHGGLPEPGTKRLFIVHLETCRDLPSLKRL